MPTSNLGTQVTIAGSPIVSFEFEGLPSVNTHYNKHFRPRSIDTAEWRYEAREKALDWIGFREGPIIQRGLVIVKVWPPSEGIMDIHNVHVKPLFDGFSDAKLWVDDEWAFLPLVMTMFAGIGNYTAGQYAKRRTVLEIHELRLVNDNGVFAKLPKGRRWLEEEALDKWMGDLI